MKLPSPKTLIVSGLSLIAVPAVLVAAALAAPNLLGGAEDLLVFVALRVAILTAAFGVILAVTGLVLKDLHHLHWASARAALRKAARQASGGDKHAA